VRTQGSLVKAIKCTLHYYIYCTCSGLVVLLIKHLIQVLLTTES